jgi:formate dehydrogenase major subunit
MGTRDHSPGKSLPPVESHPVGFHWPVLAQQRGGILIHVDPRYTRTSAVADVFVKIRAGTDIAFLGGITRYILEGERYFREYVVHYTNAATLIADEYRGADESGLFAGFDPTTGSYNLIPGPGSTHASVARMGLPGSRTW